MSIYFLIVHIIDFKKIAMLILSCRYKQFNNYIYIQT